MAKAVRRILVSNDDGIGAEGLKTAIKIAQQLSDDVWTVAPWEEQSGASHSLSLSKPMRLIKKGAKRFAVTGTPTDCVMLATRSLLLDNPPDLLISGVNFGQNIAEDVSYSGTVSAAKEGTVVGIRSVALSQTVAHDGSRAINFGVAEKHGAKLLKKLLSLDWSKDTLMNINFPHIATNAPCAVKITRQGKRDARILCIEQRVDPRNNPYYWYDFNRAISRAPRGSDIEAIMQGNISITPLQMDHTNRTMKSKLKNLFE
ncbi:MAG: 5'/3'-nucleotidase SurE [Parvibaculales bacterium]